MALTEVNGEKKSDPPKSSDKKEKPLTKVIVRRLPPTIDLETFLNQISPAPDYNYIYLAKGDSSLKEHSFCRVYINFVCPEDVYDFKERFDNYVFLDAKGHEFPAVVEFASFQKIPKKRGKVRMDPKSGTIESDPIYLEFVEMMNKPHEQDEKPEYTLQLTNENKNDTTTPLLEYIKNKRAERIRFREGRREERKRKEMERKKGREEERRKPNDEKSPITTVVIKPQGKSSPKEDKGEEEEENLEKDNAKLDVGEEKSQKVYERSSYYKNKEKKFDKYEDRRKDRPKYKEYGEKHDYKRNSDYRDYRSSKYDKYDYKKDKYDEYKKEKYDGYRKDRYEDYSREDTKAFPKKVKKYSEKREERKMEAQKAEQRKQLEQAEKSKEPVEDAPKSGTSKFADKFEEVCEVPNEAGDGGVKSTDKEKKDSDSKDQKRIRNKDRPALTIYRPGMLSRRKQNEGDTESK